MFEANAENPGRSTAERKAKFAQLLNQIEDIDESENLGLDAAQEVSYILEELNNLEAECPILQRVERTDETLLDCLAVSSASDILAKVVEAVDVSTASYEPEEFANNIIAAIAEDDEEDSTDLDFSKLINDARQIVPSLPNYEFLFGSFDLNKLPEPRQRRVNVRQRQEKQAVKKPEKVVLQEQEEESIEAIVKTLHDVLLEESATNNEQPIKYYEYVIDTSSFAQTVENMFYFSFLVRNGKAAFDLDSRGNPIIKPVKKQALKDYREGGGKDSQVITSISYEDWEKFKTMGFLQKRKSRKDKN